MKKLVLRSGGFAGLVLVASPALACPFCVTETGRRVREGVFGPGFGVNLAAVMLPFSICLGVASAIHPGLPLPAWGKGRRAARTVREGEARPDAGVGERNGGMP